MIQPKKGEASPDGVLISSATENSLLDVPQPKSPLDPNELAALREFFQLLAEWDQALKGETTDE